VSDEKVIKGKFPKRTLSSSGVRAVFCAVSPEYFVKYKLLNAKLTGKTEHHSLLEAGIDLLWEKHGDPDPDNLETITDNDG
jgi:hypothetical protein